MERQQAPRSVLPAQRRIALRLAGSDNSCEDCLVRPATEDDLDAVLEMQQMTMAPAKRATRETLQAHLETSPETFLVLLERESERCVGYAIASVWAFRRSVDANHFNPNGDVRALHDRDGSEIQIAAVVVNPEVQGRGFGSFLFGRVIHACRQHYPKCRTAIMMVERGAAASRDMATRRRFLVVDHWSNLWQDMEGRPVSAVLMRKHFGQID
jgi:ribosomal protein S18 acetylase RimI-like enzyme